MWMGVPLFLYIENDSYIKTEGGKKSFRLFGLPLEIFSFVFYVEKERKEIKTLISLKSVMIELNELQAVFKF